MPSKEILEAFNLVEKREEIREDVARTFYESSDVSKTIAWLDLPEETRESFFQKANNLLFRLDRNGCVLKVERELPVCECCEGTGLIGGSGINDCCPECNGTGKIFCTGYVAVEPLVEQ